MNIKRNANDVLLNNKVFLPSEALAKDGIFSLNHVHCLLKNILLPPAAPNDFMITGN